MMVDLLYQSAVLSPLPELRDSLRRYTMMSMPSLVKERGKRPCSLRQCVCAGDTLDKYLEGSSSLECLGLHPHGPA
jgi:hypothetical protein